MPGHALKRFLLCAALTAIAPAFSQGAMAAARCKPSDITQHEAAQLALLAGEAKSPGVLLAANLEWLTGPDGQPLDPAYGDSLNFNVFPARPKPGGDDSSLSSWY